MRCALIAGRSTPTNDALAGAFVDGLRWELMTPVQALAELRSGDAALGRPFPAVRPPVVVKPRFGSGGKGVTLCEDEEALCDALSRLSSVEWFEQQGALVQELVPPQGYDLRILVAGQRVAGAVFRIAAGGEWRTNVSLGGLRRAVADPPPHACELALTAARVVGASLVGVDLVQDGLGDWTIIELNGAVEFTREYQPEGDVFGDVSAELMRAAVASVLAAAA
jgi:glutathione synthase/RimK-type ligase-like ATP-grasp enzyme